MSTREGFGRGRIDLNYPGVNNGIPLLSSFYFRFELSGSSEAVDNHINSIRVLPAGDAEDLSPTAGLPVETVERGKISLMYRDEDADDAKDRYFYKVSHRVESFKITSPTPVTRRFQIRDVGCVGRCERVLPRPPSDEAGVFVLVGFQIFFTGSRDNHIRRIGLFENGGKLIVMLNDDDNRDEFEYIVDYALWKLPPFSYTAIKLGEESGTARGGAREALPEGQKVIRGFRFAFQTVDGPLGQPILVDHHLREIGVLTTNENLEVFYGDRSGDDQFDWNVQWATNQPLINPNE